MRESVQPPNLSVNGAPITMYISFTDWLIEWFVDSHEELLKIGEKALENSEEVQISIQMSSKYALQCINLSIYLLILVKLPFFQMQNFEMEHTMSSLQSEPF